MDLAHRLSISYYKTITTLNEEHKIYLVQHQETGKIYVGIRSSVIHPMIVDVETMLMTEGDSDGGK